MRRRLILAIAFVWATILTISLTGCEEADRYDGTGPYTLKAGTMVREPKGDEGYGDAWTLEGDAVLVPKHVYLEILEALDIEAYKEDKPGMVLDIQ